MARKYQNCSIIVPSMRMDGTNVLLRKPFNLYRLPMITTATMSIFNLQKRIASEQS